MNTSNSGAINVRFGAESNFIVLESPNMNNTFDRLYNAKCRETDLYYMIFIDKWSLYMAAAIKVWENAALGYRVGTVQFSWNYALNFIVNILGAPFINMG